MNVNDGLEMNEVMKLDWGQINLLGNKALAAAAGATATA